MGVQGLEQRWGPQLLQCHAQLQGHCLPAEMAQHPQTSGPCPHVPCTASGTAVILDLETALLAGHLRLQMPTSNEDPDL